MKKRLFLTGPIGCGKSTAIASALGERIAQYGGFRTRRYLQPHLHFALESTDGEEKRIFLDFASGKPELDLSAFSHLDLSGRVLLLDEIGGIELLNPDFRIALDECINRDIPIIGVLKGEGAAGALMDTLGLSDIYEREARQLRQRLQTDPDTLVYPCGQFDATASQLARQWVEEYLPVEECL